MNNDKQTFDLNKTEVGALKHALLKFGTSYAKVQKTYFPNYERKQIQNYVERHPELLEMGKKRKKEITLENKKEKDKKLINTQLQSDSDIELDDEEDEEDDEDNMIIVPSKTSAIIPYTPTNFNNREMNFNTQFVQKNDLVDERLKPYLAIPADLLSSEKNYHVIYRCHKGQTVQSKFDSIKGIVELHICTEPLFSSEYRLTQASIDVPKPKHERHYSIIPVTFPNDASIGHATRHDYITELGRIVEIIVPRVKSSEFTLDAPLSQLLRPRDEVEFNAVDNDSPPPKKRRAEPAKPKIVKFVKDAIEIGDKVEIWYEDQSRYFIGTVIRYDGSLSEDNTEVRWGNNKSEIITLNLSDCSDNILNKDRWLFLKEEL